MINGFINVLKPPGMSSHDVVSFLRRTYKIKKVGYAGTLDPSAAGVLPIAIGKATRLIEYMTDADKSYRAELTLGYSTDSGDTTGTIVKSSDFITPEPNDINRVLDSFIGEIQQMPPMHSAIKINGVKLYDLARKGISIERPTRTVEIKKISLIENFSDHFLFDVECSKGTYIRTLCFDIGVKMNIPSVMSFLIRTRVGGFDLNHAFTLEEITKHPLDVLQNIDVVLEHMPAVFLSINLAQAFKQGQKITVKNTDIQNSLVRIYENDDDFIGIGEFNTNKVLITPIKVITR